MLDVSTQLSSNTHSVRTLLLGSMISHLVQIKFIFLHILMVYFFV